MDYAQEYPELKRILGKLNAKVISQGAEAIVFCSSSHPYDPTTNDSYILKYRPPKKYRQPILDQQLTKRRTLAEARMLIRLNDCGVSVPRVEFIDPQSGLIWMTNIKGVSLKQYIWDLEAKTTDESIFENLLLAVGREVGLMHRNDIVHGDLTTSNIMIDSHTNKPVLIDFGLASMTAGSTALEDKAVDIYVMERAVLSTHPVKADSYNQWMLAGYLSIESKSTMQVMKRLADVRMRGRKRSMIG